MMIEIFGRLWPFPKDRDQAMASWQPYHKWRRGGFNTAVGNIQVREKVWSPQLANYRNLFVYLPPSYESEQKRYPVLYMHDGQNLFDQSTSFAEEWRVDETMERLSQEGIEAIVVGIPNRGVERLVEYSPFYDAHHGPGRGDRYLAFLEETVKPLIDGDFRTLPGREHTGVMGSSMGALITLYAFFTLPHLFSFAGVMSPSFWYAGKAIFPFVRDAAYVPGRIYMDVGTREYGGSMTAKGARDRSRRHYGQVRRMKRILVRKGYRPRSDLLVVEEKWAAHHEPAWASRLPDALRFLLGAAQA